MANQLYQWPDANTYGTISANSTRDLLLPAAMVAAFQDFSFEFHFPNVDASHAGTTAAIFRALSNPATAATNQQPVVAPVTIEDQAGSTVFIREVYGLICKQIMVRVTTGSAPVQFRLSALGVSL